MLTGEPKLRKHNFQNALATAPRFQLMGCFARSTPLEVMHEVRSQHTPAQVAHVLVAMATVTDYA